MTTLFGFAKRMKEVSLPWILNVGEYYYYESCRDHPDIADDSSVCLATKAHPCCPTNLENGNKISSPQINVAGEQVTVAFYITQDGKLCAVRIFYIYLWYNTSTLHGPAGVCYRLDDQHLRARGCSALSDSVQDEETNGCRPRCNRVTTCECLHIDMRKKKVNHEKWYNSACLPGIGFVFMPLQGEMS